MTFTFSPNSVKAENERFVPTIQWTETINISDDEQGLDLEGVNWSPTGVMETTPG